MTLSFLLAAAKLSVYALYICNAGGADFLALNVANALGAAAKKAGRVILGENDSVTLNEYFNGIGGADSHLCSHFLGYYYAPKLVHVSYDSCRFH